MHSVGILASGQNWSDLLREVSPGKGPDVRGWVDPKEADSEAMHRLIEDSDLVWIPERINGGMEEAITVIRRSRHLSLGFPVSEFTDQAGCLVKLAAEARVQVQVGHPERHRLVFRSTLPFINHPQHIKLSHHLPGSPDNPSDGALFNEILADLDLVLGLPGSLPKKVRTHASFLGAGLLFQVDSRIEFHNGSVISLLIRRFEPEATRCIEIIQESGHLSVDLVRGTSHYRSPEGSGWNTRQVWPLSDPAGDFMRAEDAREADMARQCMNFIHALEMGKKPLSSLEEGYAALEIARQIEASIGRF